jgi:hypothetical protein
MPPNFFLPNFKKSGTFSREYPVFFSKPLKNTGFLEKKNKVFSPEKYPIFEKTEK